MCRRGRGIVVIVCGKLFVVYRDDRIGDTVMTEFDDAAICVRYAVLPVRAM